MQISTCEGCGYKYQLPVWPGRHRVVRCYHCPPIPDMASQLEGLLDEVWRCEEDERLNDRIDLALGLPAHSRRHVCALPIAHIDSLQSFVCPECRQRWQKPIYYGWRPEL